MKQVVLGLLLAGTALAGGREPGATMPMQHAGMNHSVHSMEMQMAKMLTPLRPLSGKAFDVAWTKAMIDHHQMAVDMSLPEVKLGGDARVKAAAQKVIDAQRGEIAMMQGWIKAWTGQSYMPKRMPMAAPPKNNVDRWFLEGMIPHHQGAVDMSRMIPARTQNADLRKFGQDVIRVQSAEIAQYRQLLKTMK